jgi:hypothetical protein
MNIDEAIDALQVALGPGYRVRRYTGSSKVPAMDIHHNNKVVTLSILTWNNVVVSNATRVPVEWSRDIERFKQTVAEMKMVLQ